MLRRRSSSAPPANNYRNDAAETVPPCSSLLLCIAHVARSWTQPTEIMRLLQLGGIRTPHQCSDVLQLGRAAAPWCDKVDISAQTWMFPAAAIAWVWAAPAVTFPLRAVGDVTEDLWASQRDPLSIRKPGWRIKTRSGYLCWE